MSRAIHRVLLSLMISIVLCVALYSPDTALAQDIYFGAYMFSMMLFIVFGD